MTTKKCRVCGKSYEYCRTFKTSTEFRWQEVSCSPECGSIYLKRILESRRRPAEDNTINDNPKSDTSDDLILDSDDNYDYELEFDDDEEDDEEFDMIVNGI